MTFKDITANIFGIMQSIHDDFVALPEFETVVEVAPNEYAFKKVDENLYIHIKEDFRSYRDDYWMGFSFFFSSDWDTTNKVGSGTMKELNIPIYEYGSYEERHDTYAEREPYLLLNYDLKYFLDKYGVQAVLRNPHSHSYGPSVSTIFNLEFIPVAAREFDDGMNSLFAWKHECSAIDNTLNHKNAVRGLNYHSINNAYKLFNEPKPAFKSPGNNKIYFEFPYYYNDFSTNAYLTPIARTRRFFQVNKNDAGLIANDIITWIDPDGATLRKFIVLEVTSEDGSTPTFYAIPYENAYQYSTT